MLANHVFWRFMLFNTHLLLLLQSSVLLLSIVNFVQIWCFTNQTPIGGLPRLEPLHVKIWPRLRGLPSLADWATRLGGSPHLSCKCDQIKMSDHMNRRVTPPKLVTPPTWGPPPPCKQALIPLTIDWIKVVCPLLVWKMEQFLMPR